MNKCIFVGRMVADPELRYSKSGIANCAFRIAVNRTFKNAQGSYDADFIQCVAWRQTAEFMSRYLHKGDMIAVCGALQNRSYQAQDGSTRWVTEIIVDNVQACGSVRRADDASNAAAEHTDGGFTEVDDDELPF